MRAPLIFISILLTNWAANAQRTIPPTDSLKILGKIKNEKTFALSDLDTFPKTTIRDQVIYNHKGEVKDTLKSLKGITLKSVLSSIEFVHDKPKQLNEFYFVFIASDGYKVVFSWNEIYNTETGNHFFIVAEMDGIKLKDLAQRILFISTRDLKAGRRYIKGLERIEVRQVD